MDKNYLPLLDLSLLIMILKLKPLKEPKKEEIQGFWDWTKVKLWYVILVFLMKGNANKCPLGH